MTATTSVDMNSKAWTNSRTGFLTKAAKRDRRLAKAARLHSIPSDQRRKNTPCNYGYTRQNVTLPYQKSQNFQDHWEHPMTHHTVLREDLVRKSTWKVPGASNPEESPFQYTHEALVSTATLADLPRPTVWADWVAAHPNVNTATDK